MALHLPVPTEHQEQRALFQWARSQFVNHPELRWLYAIPNGGKRDEVTAKLLKDEGVQPGYPDVGLDVARGGFHGLRIEMKRRERSQVSPHQRAWCEWLRSQDYCWIECRGWNEAIGAILRYLRLPKTEIRE